MIDANQRWDVNEAIERVQALARYDIWWIEEPTFPDDVLGHAAIARGIAPIRVATGEHCANRVLFKQLLQAEAIGRLPDRQLPARRRQRESRRHADGREVRGAGVSARRRCRSVRTRSAPIDVRLHRASRGRWRTA